MDAQKATAWSFEAHLKLWALKKASWCGTVVKKLVQQHTVLLRPCRRGTCRLLDGCVFLEEVGSYPPRL